MNTPIPFWHYPEGGTLALSGSSHYASGYDFYDGSPPPPTIRSETVTTTATGGTPPYTYAWAEVGGPSGIHIGFPTSQSTDFWEEDPLGAWVKEGDFRCTVTDNVAATATWDVHVTLEQTT